MEAVSAVAAHFGESLSSSYSNHDNAHPNNYGHAGPVPAILVVLGGRGQGENHRHTSHLVVWHIAVPVVSTLAKKREGGERSLSRL
jgi:hypothetical protein